MEDKTLLDIKRELIAYISEQFSRDYQELFEIRDGESQFLWLSVKPEYKSLLYTVLGENELNFDLTGATSAEMPRSVIYDILPTRNDESFVRIMDDNGYEPKTVINNERRILEKNLGIALQSKEVKMLVSKQALKHLLDEIKNRIQSNVNFWWINAAEKWNIDSLEVGGEENYSAKDAKGKYKRYVEDLREGDLLVGYQAKVGIVGLLQITQEANERERYHFKLLYKFEERTTLQELKKLPLFSQSSLSKTLQGSLHMLDRDLFLEILNTTELTPIEPNVEVTSISAVLHSDNYAEEDLLNFELYSQAISSFIKHKSTRAPLTIGVLAPWGRGKTSLMRFIARKFDGYQKQTYSEASMGLLKNSDLLRNFSDLKYSFDKLQYPIIWFNAWKYQNADQIWSALAHETITQLVKQLPNDAARERFHFLLHLKRINKDKVRTDLHNYAFKKLFGKAGYIAALVLIPIAIGLGLFKWFPNFAGLAGFLSIIPTLAASYFANLRQVSNEEVKINFNEYLKQPDYSNNVGLLHQVEDDLRKVFELLVDKEHPAIIFIDDLDRCSPQKTAEVIEAINLFISSDFNRCFFILGQDAQMVAASLEVAYKDINNKLSSVHRSHGSLGWYFLEKFIQLQFSIPSINGEQSKNFLSELLKTEERRDADDTNMTEEIIEQKSRTPQGRREIATSIEKLPKSKRKVALQEKFIEEQAKNFDDHDPEVQELIDTYSEYLESSPRLIKRFVNLYRFYRFMQLAAPDRGIENINPQQIGGWVVIMLKWPQFSRFIQWENDKIFDNQSPIEKVAQIESRIKAGKWSEFLTTIDTSDTWMSDESLIQFLEKFLKNNSLKAGFEVGIW